MKTREFITKSSSQPFYLYIIIIVLSFILFCFFICLSVIKVQIINKDIRYNQTILQNTSQIYLHYLGEKIDEQELSNAVEYIVSNWHNTTLSNELSIAITNERNTIGFDDYTKKVIGICHTIIGELNIEMEQIFTYRDEIIKETFIVEISLVVISILSSIGYFLISRTTSKPIYFNDLLFNLISFNSNNIFFCFDHFNRQLEYISDNLERITGISKETCEKRIKNADYPYDEYTDFFNFIRNPDYSITPTNSFEIPQPNNKKSIYISFNVFISEYAKGKAKEIFIGFNTTEIINAKKQLELALEVANNANIAKRKFLSHVTHEMRTPIHAVIGATELARKSPQPEMIQNYLEKINYSTSHLLSLINNCLDMTKIESGKTEYSFAPFHLSTLIKEIISISLPRATFQMQDLIINVNNIHEEVIISDYLKLKQSLLNIITNAIKFNNRGKPVIFSIDQTIENAEAITRFTIQDFGAGMSSDVKERIFAPFFQGTNIEGTGLGLPITRHFIKNLNGNISFTSEINVGTSFFISIKTSYTKNDYPKLAQKVFIIDHNINDIEQAIISFNKFGITPDIFDKIPKNINEYDIGFVDEKSIIKTINKVKPKIFFSTYTDTTDNISFIKPFLPANILSSISLECMQQSISLFNNQHILLVDDNVTNLEITSELLKETNLQVDIATSGLEAIEKFKISPINYYSIILMDVMMPNMTGYEAIQKMRILHRSDAKTIPMLALTANALNDDYIVAPSSVTDHIIKPINILELCKKIAVYLIKKDT